MKLCIVRHGSASFTSPDPARQLTADGRHQAKIAGQWLVGQFPKKPRLIASPYIRAQQTANIIAKECGLSVETWQDLTPDADAKCLIDQLSTVSDDLILVSHLPLVGHLASWLVEGRCFDQPWSPAECWLLEGDIAAVGCMTVQHIWYPVLAE